MHCRHCRSESVKKNGHDRKRKQMYLCKSCGRAFVEAFEPNRLTAEDHRFILKHYAEGVGNAWWRLLFILDVSRIGNTLITIPILKP